MADDEIQQGPGTDPHDELIQLRAEFEQSTTSLQRFAARVRCYLGAPITAIVVTVAAATWVLANLALGSRAYPPAPFHALNTFSTVAALVATILILAGQRREDEAARRVSRLTLHLAAESEHKIAKLIQLLEEQRRDSPIMPDRRDAEAEQMASSAGPRDVLKRLDRAEAQAS